MESIDRHITVQLTGVTPSLQKCTDCCNSIHCPFCSPKTFQPATKSRVLRHLEAHKRKAVKHKEYTIFKCNLNCNKIAHFHCPSCQDKLYKRDRFLAHLRICSEKVVKQGGNGILKTASNEDVITIDENKTSIVDVTSAKATNVKPSCENEETQPTKMDITSATATEVKASWVNPTSDSIDRHITVQLTGVTPSLQKCTETDCCESIHCPFCSPKIFQPANKYRVLKHLEAHKRKAVKHKEYTIFKCNLNCNKIAHFHCPSCQDKFYRRNRFLAHLPICAEKVVKQGGNDGILKTASNEDVITIDENKTSIVDVTSAKATNVKPSCENEETQPTKMDITSATATEVKASCVKQTKNSAKVHISVFKKDNIPRVTRCTECCKLFHCPICPTSVYTPRSKAGVLHHIDLHLKNAIQHEDFYITRCHHSCRGRVSCAHFHCPVCQRSVIRKTDMRRHLMICMPASCKQAEDEMEIQEESQLDADTTCTDKQATNAMNELESSSLGSPTDIPPSIVKRSVMGTTLCPHCNVEVGHLKKHIYRKHTDKAARDTITSDSHLGAVCQDVAYGIVKKWFLGPHLPVQQNNWRMKHQIRKTPGFYFEKTRGHETTGGSRLKTIKILVVRNQNRRSCGPGMAAQEEFFSGIPKIPYLPSAGAGDVLCFKHYNAEEVLMGKKMEDWLRFSVCYWHTFCGTGADPFGFPTLHRSWNVGTPMDSAKKKLRAAFEFFTKLGVKYYTFHDRDMAPEGSTLEESNRNLDEITDLALQLQNQTGVKVLWVTCNLFAHPRYMNGAATNPDCHVLAYAGAQVKKGLDIAKKLGADNFVFWGGREGFLSIYNTDVSAELKHMANFFKMAINYKEKIGLKCQFLIEPKPKEPCKHQYDYDAMSVIGFLKHFGLDNHFKLNIEPNHTTLAGHSYEHDIVMASAFGMLGSVDSNTGSPDLGWDTDQFPMDIRNTTMVMKTVIEQGGLQPGGLNFDAKVRRESTDLEDLFIAHIGAMDAFARGLRNAVHIVEEGLIAGMLKERYSSFSHGIGQKVEEGSATLEDMEAFMKQNGEPKVTSGKQEKYESIFNHYI